MRNITARLAREYTNEFSRPMDWVFEAGLPHAVVKFVHCISRVKTISWVLNG